MQILTGHTTQETAYVVDDYPYGFKLRCKIRYWLEYKNGQGFRLVSQTTNPKVAGEVWNKPKASTYSPISAVMFLDDNGHVQWSGISPYWETGEVKAWRDQWSGIEGFAKMRADAFIKLKEAYDAKRAAAKAA